MNQNISKQTVKRRIYSFPKESESRAEAICRAFRQYTLVDWTQYNKVALQIVTSVKHPLLMSELALLTSVALSFKYSTTVELNHETKVGKEDKLLLIIQAYQNEDESMDRL